MREIGGENPPNESALFQFLEKVNEALSKGEELGNLFERAAPELAALHAQSKLAEKLDGLTTAVTALADPESPPLAEVKKLAAEITKLLKAVKNINPGGAPAAGYQAPTYRRQLRANESIFDTLQVKGITDRRLLAAWKKLKVAVAAEVVEILGEGKTPAHLIQKIDDDGYRDARNAVEAALIDRANLDQTTRLLLTTPGLLDVEFWRVADKKQPPVWDTKGVVETILRSMQSRARALFTLLAEEYAQERGWNDAARDAVVDQLTNRYRKIPAREVPHA